MRSILNSKAADERLRFRGEGLGSKGLGFRGQDGLRV